MSRLLVGIYACLVASLMAGSAGLPEVQAQRPTSVAADIGVQPVDVFAREVSVNFRDVPFAQALDSLSASANVRIQYRAEVLQVASRRVSLRADKMTLGIALGRLLVGMPLMMMASGEDAVTIRTLSSVDQAVDGTIIGRVIHAKTKLPLTGVVIQREGKTEQIVTGEDGRFRIVVPAGDAVLVVRAIGFSKQRVTASVSSAATTTVEIVLEPSTSVLDEVVVTGTIVATERKAIPNPITVITGDEIEKRGITRIEQLLRGQVPGVFANDEGTLAYGSSLGASSTSKVYTRGSSHMESTSGAPTPLKTYVDGVEILDPSYLGTIDPKSIDRIEIITGPQAATVYGSGALGGVMQIFTRKGSGAMAPEFNVALRYGMLESNMSNGRTPAHNHSMGVNGGNGPGFSYATTLSYSYTGQWQPNLFARTYGLSVGITHARGPFTASGSVSATRGMNGIEEIGLGPIGRERGLTGQWERVSTAVSQRRSTMSSQTVSLNADYQQTRWLQHHVTLGTSQTGFGLIPRSAMFKDISDTLYRSSTMSGMRTTVGYNTTMVPGLGRFVSSTLTLGMSASSADQTTVEGCMATKTSTSFIGCDPPWGTVRTSRSMDETSYGGFGRWQIGLANMLYLTLGIRGEHNPNYGSDHKIDWTPASGLTFTIEKGDLAVKFLGSYGRATRPPSPNQRLLQKYVNPNYEPSEFITVFANPDLRPEYSRGPQGGIEMYFGNLGFVTVNRYIQTVSDLIQPVAVDSLLLTWAFGTFWNKQNQYQNVAEVRNHGWELTGGLNIANISVQGTYTWSDSRISAVPPGSYRTVGETFQMMATHFGSITVGYAFNATSVSVVTNYRGAMRTIAQASSTTANVWYDQIYDRQKTYTSLFRSNYAETWQPGYFKSDLAASQRLSGALSLTLNMVNLGNSRGGESMYVTYPTLGRQTTVGFSYRWGKR